MLKAIFWDYHQDERGAWVKCHIPEDCIIGTEKIRVLITASASLRDATFAQVTSIACSPLWLKICHWHIFLTAFQIHFSHSAKRKMPPEGGISFGGVRGI